MKKFSRAILWTLFIVYCLIVMYLVFFSRGFRTQYTYSYYFKYFTNFIPLKTIVHYIQIYCKGWQSLAIFNLLGNFVLFLPMGMLLPCVFKKIDCLWKVTLCVFITVLLVEATQFLLRVGIIDVDDLIFNVVGAMIGYGIIKIPCIRKAFVKVGLLERKEDTVE